MDSIDVMDAVTFSEIASSLMADFGIPPTPVNYQIWFTYAANTDEALRRALDEVIASDQTFTSERNAYIASRFFGKPESSSRIESTSDQLGQIVTRLVDTISEAKGDATEFGKRVAHFSHEARQAETSEQCLALTRSLLQEALRAINRNEKMKKELEDAKAEVNNLRHSLSSIKSIAMTDDLTGIGNRRAFDMQMSKEIADAVDSGSPLTIVLVDIDHFKKFNDKFGHQIGDQVLKIVAQQIKGNMKPGYFAARYGGEEFAMILPETPLSAAVPIAERIRTWLAAHDLKGRKTAQNYGKITASFGIACYRCGETTDSFIRRADVALYRAKQNGRDRVETETADDCQPDDAIAI